MASALTVHPEHIEGTLVGGPVHGGLIPVGMQWCSEARFRIAASQDAYAAR